MTTQTRAHLLELHDQPWCPAPIRDGVTDQLRFSSTLLQVYAPIAGRLRDAMTRSGSRRIVDLCAGAGGPWSYLLEPLSVVVDRVVLTDYFPNQPALRRLQTESDGRISHCAEPIDATAVPEALDGFRTVFTAFHHFRPEQARAILQDAVDAGVGIGVFEQTRRSAASLALVVAGVPIAAATFTPMIRPARWSRLLLTYVLPAIPLAMVFDGVVSCLRSYSPEQLRAMVESLDAPGYAWDIGIERSGLGPSITYLIGHPPVGRACPR